MPTAIGTGIFGLLSAIAVGTQILGWDVETCLRAVAAANIAGFLGLLITLRAERSATFKKRVLNSGIKTWILLSSVYSGIILALVPHTREIGAFLWMFLPLLLSTGFGIIAFGPVQDRIVQGLQRKQRPQPKQYKESENGKLRHSP